MAIFFSSVFLMLASPMILISFVVRRRTTSSPDTIGAVTIPENIDTFTRGRGIIRTAGKICCLFCLFTVLTFFMAYARLQITRTGFFSTLATKSALELNCLQIVADYRPKDFIGIYGDMTGQYHREIDSLSTLSQALFDQGMLHTYGFNTVEGIRNFEACLEEDPTCAMCHWGVAYANGPNINTDVSNAMAVAGRKSIQIALKLMNSKSYENTITIKKLSEENKALIMAQEKEFSFKSIEEWVEKKQQFYDLQYMESMKESLIAFPEDIDIAVMYAESIMNLSPWQYYVGAVDKVSIQYDAHKPRKTKQLLDNMKLALDVLKNAILRSPFHPLALHLWIHVTESSSDPSHGEVYRSTNRSLTS